MGLTPTQLEAAAVEEIPRDTCVVAGPGSGKTTVLVAHFERLVESGVDPLRILAITFTDKAANNMRDKLAHAFRDRAEIRGKLERAYVSTVHGFCARLLKENAVFAGLDPEFYVMDERESLREQRRAIDQALDEMLEKQPERMRALMRGLAAIDMGAEMLDAYDAIRAAGVKVGDLSGFAAPPASGHRRRIRRSAKPAPVGLEIRPTGAPARGAGLGGAHRGGLAERTGGAPCGPCVRLPANYRSCSAAVARPSCLSRLRTNCFPNWNTALITAYYAADRATIFDLFAGFDSLYRKRKRQLGALDYDDLEECAVQLLEEHPNVRHRLQNQFDQVLMDEFQDTNGRQAKLLELIRPPDRFYAVGDINQSIYGFRHAEPGVFRGYRDIVERDGKRLVQLVENFRSRPEILRAVETVANGAEGVEARPLIAGKMFPRKTEAPVEVMAAATPEVRSGIGGRAHSGIPRQIAVARPPAEFQDFAVLVRNSEVLDEFTRAFDECGIPYLVNRGKGFYETREVVDLMHLLRVLANPRDEISMAAVLRSPFVGASDEDVAALSSCHREAVSRIVATRQSLRRRLQARFRDRLDAMAHDAGLYGHRPIAAARHRRVRLRGPPRAARRGEYREVSGAGACGERVADAGGIRGGDRDPARIEAARAGRAAGRFGQRREDHDRARGQRAGVSGGVSGGYAQGHRLRLRGRFRFRRAWVWACVGIIRFAGTIRTMRFSTPSARN